MKRSLCLTLLISFGFLFTAFADYDYLTDDWVGKKFVILPKPEDQRIYGYSCLRRSEGGYIIPKYDEAAGRIVTVTELDKPPRGDVHVHLFDEKTEYEYLAVAAADHVPCIAPLADFELANRQWQGKTIWIKHNKFLLDTEGKRLAEDKRFPRYSAVHVDTIIAGYSPSQPVRLVLTSGDNVACTDIRVSDINTPQISRGPQFADMFFEQDPRVIYPWGSEVWGNIEKGQISRDMTMEQVQMSWGPPQAVTKIEGQNCDCEEWEYDKTIVHFRDGKVDEIKD